MNGVNDVLHISKEAVYKMIRKAKYSEDCLDCFAERQLEHEIGFILNKRKYVTFFDSVYTVNRLRTDIMSWPLVEEGTGTCYWVETKLSKFSQNSPSLEFYKHDFEKLREPHYPQWASMHRSYWVWLHIFKELQATLREELGTKDKWNDYVDIKKFTELLNQNEKPKNLANLLNKIYQSSKDSACSIRPCLVSNRLTPALIVVAKLK